MLESNYESSKVIYINKVEKFSRNQSKSSECILDKIYSKVCKPKTVWMQGFNVQKHQVNIDLFRFNKFPQIL